MAKPGRCIVLVGGGRWARVHAGVVCSLHPRVERLLWVTHYNRSTIEQRESRPSPVAVEMVDSLGEAMHGRPDAAIVCTSSAEHARNAIACLDRDLPVLIEKPLALETSDALAVVARAKRKNLLAEICLPLLHASYLRRFKAACAGRTIATMRIDWLDAESELRYGETKLVDLATHVVDEVLPHVWSLIELLTQSTDIRIVASGIVASDIASLELACDRVTVMANFGRHAAARARRIELRFVDGGSAGIDFAIEPGRAVIDDRELADDGSWEREPHPLASIHGRFLDDLDDPRQPGRSLLAAEGSVRCVALAAEARQCMVAHAAAQTATLLDSGVALRESREAHNLILDNIGPELARAGIRVAAWPKALRERLIDAVAEAALNRTAIGFAADMPWLGMLDSSAFVAAVRGHLPKA